MADTQTELTGDEIAQIQEIFGIPESTAVAATSFTHLPPLLAKVWEPTYTTGDFSALWTQIMAQINKLSTYKITRIRIYLVRWDAIGGSSVTRITSSQGGDSGVITDDALEQEKIRHILGDLIGIIVPQGGFYEDMKVRLAYSSARNQLQSSGDR